MISRRAIEWLLFIAVITLLGFVLIYAAVGKAETLIARGCPTPDAIAQGADPNCQIVPILDGSADLCTAVLRDIEAEGIQNILAVMPNLKALLAPYAGYPISAWCDRPASPRTASRAIDFIIPGVSP